MAYDQEFFLALAAKGKDAWNAWRRDPANKDARVTFAGIDFSEAPRDGIDFSGFEFGVGAKFWGCRWRGSEYQIGEDHKAFKAGRACFTGATFYIASFRGGFFGNYASFVGASINGWAIFDGAIFGDDASFDSAAFGDDASFVGAAFGDRVSFTRTAFGNSASFAEAVFYKYASFTGAAFGGGAFFLCAAFREHASFTGAAFGNEAYFGGSFFKGRVEFTGKSIKQWSRPLDERIHGVVDTGACDELEKRHEESWTRNGSGPDRCLTISFAQARFNGEATFSGRTFERAADFINARFFYPPDFDAVTNASRIDFTGALIGFVPPGKFFHWTTATNVPVRLRAFRKIAEDTKNHDLERDLYIEERKAERGVYLTQWWGDLKSRSEELKKTLVEIDKQKKWAFSKLRQKVVALVAYVFGIIAKIPQLIGHLFWIVVMFFYLALADYGRSFLLPLAWLGLSGYVFCRLYFWIMSPKMAKADPLDIDKYKHAVQMLAFGNTVPFVGPLTIDSEIKKFLFCPGFDKCLPIPPEWFQLLVIGQNLVSIILVFFIGLALRNYFRIK